MLFRRACTQWSSRSFHQSSRAARNTRRTRSSQLPQRRTYASEGDHGSHQKSGFSGDLPWAIGSLVVTIPSVWYLAQPQIERMSGKKGGHGEHGHGHGHDEDKEEEAGSNEGGETSEGEQSEEDTQNEDAPKEEENGGESDNSEGEGEERKTPETPDDKGSDNEAHETESGGNVEGVQFKGATGGGNEKGEQEDTRKHIPDAKGGNKKRIESHYGGKEGEATTPQQDPSNEDLGATSKPAGGKGTQSGKQEGLSNTDTKHSTDIANSPEKSTKPTGGPETAKEKGTVDPSRPQV